MPFSAPTTHSEDFDHSKIFDPSSLAHHEEIVVIAAIAIFLGGRASLAPTLNAQLPAIRDRFHEILLSQFEFLSYPTAVSVLHQFSLPRHHRPTGRMASNKSTELLVQLLQPFGVSVLDAKPADQPTAAAGGATNRTLQQTETSHVRRNLREHAQAHDYVLRNRTRVLGDFLYAIKLMLSDQLDAPIDILYNLSWKIMEFLIAREIVDIDQYVGKSSLSVLDWVHSQLASHIPQFVSGRHAQEMLREMAEFHEDVTATSVKNMREYAEDRLFIWHGRLHENVTELGMVRQTSMNYDETSKEFNPRKPRALVSLYAIFDGHGGSFAAEYACKHLSIELAREIARTLDESELLQNGLESAESVEKIRRRMLESFQTIDKEILELARAVEKVDSGTTATVCVVIETPEGVVPVVARGLVMWVGDTQAYVVMMPKDQLGEDGKKFQTERKEVLFTSAHNTRNADERKRIQTMDVKALPDDSYYILNTLSVTRVFGDQTCRPYAVCEPEFWSADMSRPWVLVMASDGLWDVVSKEQILASSERMLEKNRTRDGVNVSRELCQLAMKNGSLDNITIAVVTFK